MNEISNERNATSRWLTDEVFQLIEIVKENEAIYNPKHKNYFCRPHIERFWNDVDLNLGKNPGVSLAKWTNLRISFRREYTSFMEEKIKPCWAFFDSMFFLHPYLRRKRSAVEGLESHIQEALEQISAVTRGNIKNFIENIEEIDMEPASKPPESQNEEIIQEEVLWNDDFVKEEDLDDIEEISDNENYSESNETIEVCGDNDQQAPSDQEVARNEEYMTLEEEHSYKRRHDDDQQHSSSQSPKKANLTREGGCVCKTDPDIMYLLSLLPDMQSLTKKNKILFKLGVQTILHDMLYPNEE